MQYPMERRRNERKIGEGLTVVIANKVFPLVNISETGLSFQATSFRAGDKLALKIAKLANMKDFIDAVATVVVAGDTITRCEFFSTMPLMRFIVRHVSDVTETAPSYFKT